MIRVVFSIVFIFFILCSCKENATNKVMRNDGELSSYLENIEKYNSKDFISFSDSYLLDKDTIKSVDRKFQLQKNLILYDSLEVYRELMLKLNDSLYAKSRTYIDYIIFNNYFDGDKFNYCYLNFDNDEMYLIKDQSSLSIDTIDLIENSISEVVFYLEKYGKIKSLTDYNFVTCLHCGRAVFSVNCAFTTDNYRFAFTIEDRNMLFITEFINDMNSLILEDQTNIVRPK